MCHATLEAVRQKTTVLTAAPATPATFDDQQADLLASQQPTLTAETSPSVLLLRDRRWDVFKVRTWSLGRSVCSFWLCGCVMLGTGPCSASQATVHSDVRRP